ncbi:MAG TPA: GNAT family N-acetyltransferase [Flavisolibacter sp.]|nr:GNAT family N-acetyltransferase [Flavisolibacter sp.]
MTTPNIHLRKSVPEDIESFFIFQLDDEANHMAAFTPENPQDKEAYMAKWTKNMANEKIPMYTIICDGTIAGSVLAWELEGEPQISYWLSKDFWGRCIAAAATEKFLCLYPARPIYGRVAFDNVRSARVLTKCGFRQCGIGTHYANARKAEIEERIFIREN